MLHRAYRNSSRPSLPRAFTLVELLVVVAVVTMLLGVLLPSLDAARQKSRDVACAARLQQWGLAFTCYAAEYAERLPHCDGLDRAPRHFSHPAISKEDLADWCGWADVAPPLINLPPRRDFLPNAHPGPDAFYQCPSAEILPGRDAYSYYPVRNGYFSYAMNSCLELDANAWAPDPADDLPEDYVWKPMPSFLSMTKIERPSQVVLLFDQLMNPKMGFDGNVNYRAAGQHSGSYPKAFAARHGRGGKKLGGNILFTDGHVECRDSVWKPEWSVDMEVPPRTDRNWYPYPFWWRG